MKRLEREFFGLKHTSIVIPEEKRPRCQFCNKILRLQTMWIHPNRENEWAIQNMERELAKAKAWSSFKHFDRDDFEVVLWSGKYQGQCSDERGTPIFCAQPCALGFAELQYNAGRRIELRGELLTRSFD